MEAQTAGETEWDIHARIAAAINALDPKLAARPGSDSPGIYNVRLRIAPRIAATFGQDVVWSGCVEVADEREGYEWLYLDRDGDAFGLDAPSLDFDGTAATSPAFEQEGVTPVPVGDDSIRQVAEAIVRAAHGLRGRTEQQPRGFCGYEYLQLWRDVENPKPDRRRTHDWRASARFESGTRFILSLRAGEVPELYPVGERAQRYSHMPALPATSLFAALMPSLATTWPSLREIFALEDGDAVGVLERLVREGVVSREYVTQAMREGLEAAGAKGK